MLKVLSKLASKYESDNKGTKNVIDIDSLFFGGKAPNNFWDIKKISLQEWIWQFTIYLGSWKVQTKNYDHLGAMPPKIF